MKNKRRYICRMAVTILELDLRCNLPGAGKIMRKYEKEMQQPDYVLELNI